MSIGYVIQLSSSRLHLLEIDYELPWHTDYLEPWEDQEEVRSLFLQKTQAFAVSPSNPDVYQCISKTKWKEAAEALYEQAKKCAPPWEDWIRTSYGLCPLFMAAGQDVWHIHDFLDFVEVGSRLRITGVCRFKY